MRIPISIERMEGRWIAYVTSLPGCFSSDEDRDRALEGVPGALGAYLEWFAGSGGSLDGIAPPLEAVVEEIVAEWIHPATGEAVNAFFAADEPELGPEEIDRATRLIEWTYRDLLQAASGVPAEKMIQPVEGKWSIAGILHHAARADWRYLRAIGQAPEWSQAAEGDDLASRLVWTQSLIQAALPGLAGQHWVEPFEGELWSPRKFLRRMIWHRRDHTAHIAQFRQKLGV